MEFKSKRKTEAYYTNWNEIEKDAMQNNSEEIKTENVPQDLECNKLSKILNVSNFPPNKRWIWNY